MKTVAIIQARLGSSRLPGKVLRPLGGKTMLECVMQRLSECRTIDQLVIATTTEPADRELIEFCQDRQWDFHAGSENDVLSRYVETAEKYAAEQIVRITSDCPLIDPRIVDQTVDLINSNPEIDYASNFHPRRTYPRGLDCEAMTRRTLDRIDRLAITPRYREHVTLYAYQNPKKFNIASTQETEDWSHLRWTVDTEDDLRLASEIYHHFGDSPFDWRQIIKAYETHPSWIEINRHCLQKIA